MPAPLPFALSLLQAPLTLLLIVVRVLLTGPTPNYCGTSTLHALYSRLGCLSPLPKSFSTT
jgi:hypothetical protein